jgi:hypothetical protein
MSWKERFNDEFFNNIEDLETYSCIKSKCTKCNGIRENGEPRGYGCLEQEKLVDENMHKLLEERTDACSDIKDYIEALLKETEQRAKKEMLRECIEVVCSQYNKDLNIDIAFDELSEKYKGVE